MTCAKLSLAGTCLVGMAIVLSVLDFSLEQIKVAIVLVATIIAWNTEIISPTIVSLGVIAILAIFNSISFETATAGFTEEVIWLLLAVSIIGYTLQKSGLVDRMARIVIRFGRGSVARTLLVMMLAIFILTVLVPTAIARAGLVAVLTNGVVRVVGLEHAKSFFLTATMSIFSFQLSVITGTNGSLYLVAYLDKNGPMTIDYLTWAGLMAPVGILMGLSVWLLIAWKFKLFNSKVPVAHFEHDENESLTPLQWRIIFLCISTLVIWIAGPVMGIDIYAYTLLLIVILLLPGVGGISWSEVKTSIPWDTFFLFAGALALGAAVGKLGLAVRMATNSFEIIREAPAWLVSIEILLFFLLARIIFVNLISLLVTVLPIIVLMGDDTGWNPIWLLLIGLVTGSSGYHVPAQSPVALVMLGGGHFSESDLRRMGLILTPIWCLLIIIAAFIYWPLLGLTPRI